MKEIILKSNGNAYYKINTVLKKIIMLEDNVLSYPDYEEFVTSILSFKSISSSDWKHRENTFFISRHFEWEFNGKKFRTTDNKIDWLRDKYGGATALVFHNGRIWKASNSGNYYPRVYLVQETNSDKVSIKRLIYGDKPASKWTDIKYCKHFEEY